MNYASFWKRTAAYLVDCLILGPITNFIGFLMGILFENAGLENPWLAFSLVAIFSFICVVVYYVWPESSSWQASIGKKLFGLKVTDINGQRISFWRSLGRYMGMVVSTFTLCIGFLMCIWTKKKQCLHDKIAGCLVIDDTPDKKQGCAVGVSVAILGLYGLAVVGIVLAMLLPNILQSINFAKANQALDWMYSVEAAQEEYYEQHNAYATQWKQLDFDACQQATGNVCMIKDLQIELGENTVSITGKHNIFRLQTQYGSDEYHCESSGIGVGICDKLEEADE